MRDLDLLFFPPSNSRTHEVCGSSAYFFAFALAAQLGGKCAFVREAWDPNQINPNGFAELFDPSKLILCNTKDQTESLAVSEESLRSGAVALVVTALNKPLGLTEGRRLQLAARDGKSTGLAIIPDGMGSNAAETRWHCTPVFDSAGSTLQQWKLIKNKSGTLGVWNVRWSASSRRVHVVSEARL